MLAIGGLISGCTMLTTYPDKLSQAERFKQLSGTTAPLKTGATIHWHPNAIPFVEAANDDDLAFGVGVAHAHLRIDQMELLRLVSQGRLSEVAGPIPQIADVDLGLRMIGLVESAKKTYAMMHPESRAWIEQFTAGVNWYIDQLNSTPVFHKLAGMKLDKFSIIDVLTISRLISSDLTWATYIQNLKSSQTKGFAKVWQEKLAKLAGSAPSFAGKGPLTLEQIVTMFSKSGSNSAAVAGANTSSGAAMIANDPHVGIWLPNFWLLVGMKSPTYHAIGYMIPGVPIIGVGRNKDIAWGGTNMRGISTHLYDVTDLDPAQITSKEVTISRRWWWNTKKTIRSTPFGPILTDIAMLAPEGGLKASLYWQGRNGSDEIHAFLLAARAKNWQDFRKAFTNYQVSAMNMVYADKEGNIGMVPAYGQPVLKDPSKTLDFIKSTDNPIVGVLKPTEQIEAFNPADGFIASANNKPFKDPVIPYAFSYANSDRYLRMVSLLKGRKGVTVENLKALQLDTVSEKALDLTVILKDRLGSWQPTQRGDDWLRLMNWNGDYDKAKREPLVFEIAMYGLWQVFQANTKGPFKGSTKAPDNWKEVIKPWLAEVDEAKLKSYVEDTLKANKKPLDEFKVWGDYTVFSPAPFVGRLPLIGSRYRLAEMPISGGNDTLNKYGRPFKPEKAEVSYGASARHISDMASLDENYFVMNGGQDSWMMNENIGDQLELWQKGDYLKIPLSWDKVLGSFNRHTTKLVPQKTTSTASAKRPGN